MQKFLSNIIHTYQTGFVSGRYIGENITRILSLFEECRKHDINGIMLLIDFAKAFDYIEHSFITSQP